MPLSAGDSLGPYRLVSRVGEGGMGVVWQAEDTRLGRTVAIKVLPADRATDPQRRELFLSEARLASTVSDARIAQVHDLGSHEGIDFIVMEYVEGEALSELVRRRGALPPEEVAAIGSQVAQALAKAHRKGLLHRDVKPANVLVQADGEVKLIDFGVSALLSTRGTVQDGTPTLGPDELRAAREERPHTPASSKVSGTPAYMSPEQIRGDPLDARSDIYALGVVLYELTAGRAPFGGGETGQVLEDILRHRLLPIQELVPGVPPELSRIIGKAAALRAVDRYQSTDDLAVDLRRLARELAAGDAVSVVGRRPRIGRRTWLVGAGVVAFVALSSVVFMWRHGSPPRWMRTRFLCCHSRCVVRRMRRTRRSWGGRSRRPSRSIWRQ